MSHSDVWDDLTITYWNDLELPFLQRGHCSCGSPIAIEHDIRRDAWTFSHGEIPLITIVEKLIDNVFHSRRFIARAGMRTLREAILNHHAAMAAICYPPETLPSNGMRMPQGYKP